MRSIKHTRSYEKTKDDYISELEYKIDLLEEEISFADENHSRALIENDAFRNKIQELERKYKMVQSQLEYANNTLVNRPFVESISNNEAVISTPLERQEVSIIFNGEEICKLDINFVKPEPEEAFHSNSCCCSTCCYDDYYDDYQFEFD